MAKSKAGRKPAKPKAAAPPPKGKAKKAAKLAAKKSKAAKVKTPKEIPPWATEEALALYDFETQRDSAAIAKEVEELASKWGDLKSKASNAKKQYEGRNAELLEYVDTRSEQRGKPPQTLFDKADRDAAAAERKRDAAAVGSKAADAVDKATPKGKKGEAASADAQTLPFKSDTKPDPEAWYPDDLWKRSPIERLTIYGLTKADVDKIQAGETKRDIPNVGPLNTMGDLSRFTAPPSTNSTWNRTYADLKGVGPAAVDRLTKAESMFWSAWQKGLADEFAVEQGFKKPLKVHSPEGDGDGDDAAGGTGKKGARKRKGKGADDAAPDPLDAGAAIDTAAENLIAAGTAESESDGDGGEE